MVCKTLVWSIAALFLFESMVPSNGRASELPPSVPASESPGEGPRPPSVQRQDNEFVVEWAFEPPPCEEAIAASATVEQLTAELSALRQQHEADHSRQKDKKKKKRKLTLFGRLVRLSVYTGAVGILLGAYFVGVPFYNEYRADRHYQQLILEAEARFPMKVLGAAPADFEIAAAYLIAHFDQEELLNMLRQIEHENEGAKVFETAHTLGIGHRLVDARSWEQFYRDTKDRKDAVALKNLRTLLGEALRTDWLRYGEQVGPRLASMMTFEELLKRQMEIYGQR